jgi:hypothetical protein
MSSTSPGKGEDGDVGVVALREEPAEAGAVDFSGWARPACVAQLGGFGRRRTRWPPGSAASGWPCPASAGRPPTACPCWPWPSSTCASCPAAPPALEDVALLTLFLGPWQLPVDEPNGVNWALRAYPSLDDLVPLAEPTPARAGDPSCARART